MFKFFNNLSIGTKVYLYLAITVTSTFYFVNVIRSEGFENLYTENFEENFSILVEGKSTLIEEYVEQLKIKTLEYSNDKYIRDSFNTKVDPEEVNLYLLNNRKVIDPQIVGINILDTSGKVIYSSELREIGNDESKKDFFQEVKDLELGNTSKLYSFFTNEFNASEKVFVIAAPIFERGTAERYGYITIYFDTEKLENILPDTPTTLVFLTSKEGDVFLSTNSEIDYKSINIQQYIDCNSQTKKVGEYKNVEGKNVFGGIKCIQEEWVLFYENESMGLFNKLNSTIWESRISGIFLALIFTTFFYIFLRVLFIRPINKITQNAIKLQNNDYNIERSYKGEDELGKLSNAFSLMAKKLKNYHSQLEYEIDSKTAELKSNLTEIQDKNKVLTQTQTAMINVLEDIEQEKEKTERLSNDLKKFQLAVENASDLIIITDNENKILYANPAIEEITGYTVEEALNKSPGELWGGQMDEKFYKEMWNSIAVEKKPFHAEITNLKKNKTAYIADFYVAPILNKHNDIQFYVATQKDITKAKEVDKMKTEFISLASHQLRTPLTAMKWTLELLNEGDGGKLNKTQSQYVASLSEINERMIELVNALLNISRIESGRIIIDPVKTDVEKLIHKVLDQNIKIVEDKKISVKFESLKNLPQIKIDPNLISQVFTNIYTNALKYTPEGGKIYIKMEKDAKWLITSITDTGYGIPKEDQAKIFKKFFRSDNIKKVVTDGTGLGLYLVKAIIDSSGGKVSFKSEINKGTTFTVKLPLKGSKKKEGEVTLT